MAKSPKVYKNIPVDPETYHQVRKIADNNGQSMGGLVMTWARECPHPINARVKIANTLFVYPPAGKVQVDVKVLQCRDCGRLIFIPDMEFGADERAIAAQVQATTTGGD